jgi:hypothetical protein
MDVAERRNELVLCSEPVAGEHGEDLFSSALARNTPGISSTEARQNLKAWCASSGSLRELTVSQDCSCRVPAVQQFSPNCCLSMWPVRNNVVFRSTDHLPVPFLHFDIILLHLVEALGSAVSKPSACLNSFGARLAAR